MKKVKKILALVLAMTMALGMTLVSSAAETDPSPDVEKEIGKTPSKTDTGFIQIKDVKVGDTVTIYKIVKANYNEAGFTGYEAIYTDDDIKINVENPEAAKITKLLAHLKSDTSIDSTATTTATATDVTFNNLKVGMYLVEVTGGQGSTTVYNPMVASVYYKTVGNQDKLMQGSVSATEKWEIGNTVAYTKSSNDNDITKEIVGGAKPNGDSAAVGSTVKFAIKGTIPSYDPEYYTNPTYTITDTLSEGLAFAGVEGKEPSEVLQEKANAIFGTNNATITVEGRVLTITLKRDYLVELASKPAEEEVASDAAINDRTFKFEYSATVESVKRADGSETANFDPRTNTARLQYTNKPSADSSATPVTGDEHKTYHYTFSIGAVLSGKTGVTNKDIKTDVIKKIDENGNVISVVQTLSEDVTHGNITEVLKGAKFELRQDNKTVATAVTDENGGLKFEGLKAGTYTLVETEAPSGFSLESTIEHLVVIAAEYNNDGTLKKVTITIDNTATSTYEGTYNNNGELINVSKTKETVTNITNTKLASLPSTGGIGTTIFTIGGVVLMVGAAGLFFATRKRSAK